MNEQILYIDDSEIDQQIIQILFNRLGLRLVAAHDALSGIEIARNIMPNMILLDYQLPNGISGIDAIHIIRNDALLCNIPLILVSSSVFIEETEVKALAAGANAYLSKPIPMSIVKLLEDYKILPKP